MNLGPQVTCHILGASQPGPWLCGSQELFTDYAYQSRHGGLRSPIERLARLICKAAAELEPVNRAELRVLVTPPQSISRRITRRWIGRRIDPANFDDALAMAIANRWVRETDESVLLTGIGAEVARKSRSGYHRPRPVAQSRSSPSPALRTKTGAGPCNRPPRFRVRLAIGAPGRARAEGTPTQ